MVLVENCPQVPEQVLGRLTGVLGGQIFGRCGKLVGDIYMPVNPETKKTYGFCLIEYETTEMAKTAVKSLNGLALDKLHTFKVSPYSVLQAANNTPSEYVEPEIKIAQRPNLNHHLLDPRGADQFALFVDQTVEIDWNVIDYQKTWNDPSQREPELFWHKEEWAVGSIAWSPNGSYLATAHTMGVVLWGGPPPFEKPLGKFEHSGVGKFAFSPQERFLVTASVVSSSKDGAAPKDDDPKTVVFHDIATGKRKLEFTGVKSSIWPLFRFSHNDDYFATVVKDKIQVYDSETMQLVGKTSLRIPGVKTFSWAPAGPYGYDSVIAYYVPVPPSNNQPASVTILSVPDKAVIRQKNVFDVKDCRLHWHPRGQFLCAKVDRLVGNKKKFKTARVFFGKDVRVKLLEDDPDLEPLQANRKVEEMWAKASDKVKDHYEKMALEDKARYNKELNFSTTFQIFRFDQKDVPVEELEFGKADPVVAFAWQPGGRMFAVIHGKQLKPDVSIYNVGKDGIEKLKTFEARACNALIWSPVGEFLVLANVKAAAGQLEFIHAGQLESITTSEHPGATDFAWEPRGRYFVSSISSWRGPSGLGEPGYFIFSFNGRLLAKVSKAKLFQFIWRPRPRSLLTQKDEGRVQKSMKNATALFEREDEMRRRLERKDFFLGRMAAREEYYDDAKKNQERYDALAAKHKNLVAKMERKEDVQVFTEDIEEIISEKTTVLG